MKKTVLFIAIAFGISNVFAQDLTSKKGEPMLPEANDWAISMDVDPIFTYVGNAFHGQSASGAPAVGWLNGNQTIVGKKFIDEKTAYRVLVRLGFTDQTTKGTKTDLSSTATNTYPTVPSTVEDKMSVKNTNIGIGVGKEWRRGKTRLQGYYGADVMIWLASQGTSYKYGNALSTSGNGVNADSTSTTVFNDPNTGKTNLTKDTYGNDARVTKFKSGMTFGIGIRGFIGCEYFLFPKISVGAEYGWGLGFQTSGKSTTSTESVGSTSAGSVVGSQDVKASGSSKFGIDTDMNQNNMFNFKGSNTGTVSLRATFHF